MPPETDQYPTELSIILPAYNVGLHIYDSRKFINIVHRWSPQTIRRLLEQQCEVLEIRSVGQCAALGFLSRRLFRLRNHPGKVMNAVIYFLNRSSIYSENGSFMAAARKKVSRDAIPTHSEVS